MKKSPMDFDTPTAGLTRTPDMAKGIAMAMMMSGPSVSASRP